MWSAIFARSKLTEILRNLSRLFIKKTTLADNYINIMKTIFYKSRFDSYRQAFIKLQREAVDWQFVLVYMLM